MIQLDLQGAVLAAHMSTGKEFGCRFLMMFSISLTCRSKSMILLASADLSLVFAFASANFFPSCKRGFN
jgi:hypothetical protein